MKNNDYDDSRILARLANLIFIVGILFCFLVSVYLAYKLFNPTYIPNIGNKIIENFYTTSIGIFILFGLILFVCLIKLNENVKVNVSLVFVSIFISIYALEIFLHISKKDYREIVAKKINVPYDSRTTLEVLEDYTSAGVTAYPNAFPSSFLSSDGLIFDDTKIYPFGGVSDAKIVLCNESGKWSTYNSDEYGFNNPKGLYKKNDVDIILTGDSFTEGACVDPSETISSFLRNQGYNSISIGKSGNGPLLEFASLREYAAPFKPKIVLWMYCFCDLHELKKENAPTLKKYLSNNNFSQNLILRQNEIDLVLKNYLSLEQEKEKIAKKPYIKILKLYNLRNKFNLVPTVTKTLNTISNDENTNLFREIILKSKKMTESWGGKFYFVYLPSHNKYISGNDDPNKKLVINLIKSLDIPFIDVHDDIFKFHSDPLSLFPLRIDGHYTSEGYDLIANVIKERLIADENLKKN